LKEYICVQLDNHKDVGKTIEEWQKKGWRLHTYQVAGLGLYAFGPQAYHYLLFEKGE